MDAVPPPRIVVDGVFFQYASSGIARVWTALFDEWALYGGCLFTLFPSFYEGWGLPVMESHAFGRPCIISKTTSLPEAGGSLARYIDPDNTTDAYQVIRETIQDQAGLREWRDRVRREFRPVEWSQSAHAVLKALDATKEASSA